MSAEDEEKPVIEVGEEAWEEEGGALAPTPVEASVEEAPIDEELSESLRPVPPGDEDLGAAPRVPSALPPLVRDPEFSHPAVTEPLLSVGQHLQRARRLGTGIWYAGVFLWAYLVVGEYVVGPGLPEALGWSAFAGIVVGAFLQGANRIGTELMRKAAAISAISVIGVVVFLSTIVGSSSRSVYQGMSLFLLAVSVALVFYGIHLARGGLPKAVSAPGTKWRRIVTWVLFLGNTGLIALAFVAQISGGGP